MAIAYAGERAAGNSVTAIGSPWVITLASSCSAGNLVVLHLGTRVNGADASGISVADSKGNTWTVDASYTDATNKCLALIASTQQGSGTLASGDTITVTFATTPPTNAMNWLVEEFSGLGATFVDKTAQNFSDTSVTSGTSGTTAALSQAAELAVACFCISSNAQTVTQDAGWSNYTTPTEQDAGATSGTKKTLSAQYKIVAATTALTNSQSWSVTQSYTGLVVTYPLVVAGGGGTARARTLVGAGS